VWVVDAGFTSGDNRKVLTGGGSGFIIAEKLRGNDTQVVAARGRQGRFATVEEGLQVKDIRVGEGLAQQRFIMVRNLDAAARDAYVRGRLVALLEDRIDGSDSLDADKRAELRGRIREKPGLWRYLRITPSGLLRIDRAKIAAETRLDGKTLLRTSELEVRWTPPRSPGATRRSRRSNVAGAISSSSICGRSTTARTSASSLTCSSPGWRCC
jgi:hypothetical protein